ncbi:MAG: hypothetical protein ACE5FN_08020 [Leptospirillia bacterium]
MESTAATSCASANTTLIKSVDLATDYPGVIFGYKAGINDCTTNLTAVADYATFTNDRVAFNDKGSSVVSAAAGAALQGVGEIYLTNPDGTDDPTRCLLVRGAVGFVKYYKHEGGAWTT